ncbi:translation initiation factor IF-2, partial [Linderina macrospora]
VRSNRPIIGGSARNHLKSAHASPISGLKSFFEHESAKAANTAPGPVSKAAPTESPEEPAKSEPEPKGKPMMSAGFFFMGKGSGAKTDVLPSTAWKEKIRKQQEEEKLKAAREAQKVPKERMPLGTDTAPVSADPKDIVDEHSTVVPKKLREFTKRETLAEKNKTAGKRPPPPQRRERRHVSRDHSDDTEVHDSMSYGSGILAADTNDWGQQAPRRRRRKKYRMPKKGQEVILPLSITVDGLAKLLDVPNDHLMGKMQGLGMTDKLANDFLLSNEEAAEISLEYDVVPIIPENNGPELYPQAEPEDMSVHPLRPPIVTIMGHVDHGKTTLLDTLRNSSITATEAGGITQHIGAFSVELKSGHHITFLDTPGHAAFSAMRARGANVTDIVVLVVAADDGVMPQTKEAIQHAQEADVPMIVAINKCDKQGVDPSLIKEELLQYGVQVEDFGGDIQAVQISALKGTGVDELAENIATLAEVLDLRAETDIPVHASVIESQLEKGRGNVASVLVNRGTLKVGDIIVAGAAWCKVRSMTDDRGKSVKEAGPASAVKIMGWKELPQAGDSVLQAATEAKAKEVVDNRVEKRKNKEKLMELAAMNDRRRENHERDDSERAEEKAFKLAVWEFHQGIRTTYPDPPIRNKKSDAQGETAAPADGSTASTENTVKTIPVVIKGDVSGTVEAVSDSLKQLPDKKIKINVVHAGVGPVSESDVVMAGSAGEGVIIAFNVKADKKIQAVAKREGVNIMPFRIIYKLLEDVEELLASKLEPLLVEEVQGEAVVQQVFEITLKGNKTTQIAGSRVTVGSVTKKAKARVMRKGTAIFTGDVDSLKNVKKDIAEATKGQEFGISFDGFEDLQEGDIVQSLKFKEVPQKLE